MQKLMQDVKRLLEAADPSIEVVDAEEFLTPARDRSPGTTVEHSTDCQSPENSGDTKVVTVD